jgi:hypothetical protein
MSRVYATEEDSGARVLVRLECDAAMCDAKIRPHPEIAQSGWVKSVVVRHGTRFEYAYCPEHAG